MELQIREERAESASIVNDFSLNPTGIISQHDVLLSLALEEEITRRRNACHESVKTRSWKEFYEDDASTGRSVPE